MLSIIAVKQPSARLVVDKSSVRLFGSSNMLKSAHFYAVRTEAEVTYGAIIATSCGSNTKQSCQTTCASSAGKICRCLSSVIKTWTDDLFSRRPLIHKSCIILSYIKFGCKDVSAFLSIGTSQSWRIRKPLSPALSE
jgi:hypothetical protein